MKQTKHANSSMKGKQQTKTRSFLSEYFLLWIFPTVFKGARNKLTPEQVPSLPNDLSSEVIMSKATAVWHKTHNLWYVSWEVSKKHWIFGAVCSVITGLLTVVVRPLLLGAIVDNLGIIKNTQNSASDVNLDDEFSQTLWLIFLLSFVLVAEGITFVFVKHAIADICGHAMFIGFTGLIQQKLKRLPLSSRNSQELTLIGNDAFRSLENMRFGCMLLSAFTGVIGGVTVLIVQVGLPSFVGLAVMVVILFSNLYLARRASIAEEKDLQAADERVQLLKQMITGIKAIKLCAWEESFLEKIYQARRKEMIHLGWFRLFSQSSVQVGRSSPILSAASCFLFFALSGAEITAARLFTALNVFLSLRVSLIVIPEALTIGAATRVSFNRIEQYLSQPEIEAESLTLPEEQDQTTASVEASAVSLEEAISATPAETTDKGDASGANGSEPGSEGHLPTGGGEFALQIQGCFQWPDNPEFSLNINQRLGMKKGQSLAVVARVGNGKTSFLHAILGELNGVEGYENSCRTGLQLSHSKVAFVPQQPFILGATVIDNVCVTPKTHSGVSYDISEEDKTLQMALWRSALSSDLKLLRNGLKTTIGEKGINFSGGQQQRVAIARAIFHCLSPYHNVEAFSEDSGTLLVVDDALAAVDVKVADHLFHNAFLQHLKDNKNNTLVMALNQPKYLKHFDYVLELENGKVANFLPVTAENLSKLGFVKETTQTVLIESGQGHGQNSKSKSKNKSSARQSSIKKTTQDDLYEDDMLAHGLVSWKVVKKYINAMGVFLFILCLISGLLTYSAMAFSDVWFSRWVEQAEQRGSEPQDEGSEEAQQDEDIEFVIVYALSCASFLFFLLLTSALWSYAGVRGSQNLHNDCMVRLMHAPVSFFEKTPSGRIISRFTSDLSAVDLSLARFADNLWQLSATLFAQICVVAVLVPPILIVIVISIVLYSIQVVGADRANRVVKRQNNLAMSPLQLSVSENIDAKVVARLMHLDPYFDERFHQALNRWTRYGIASYGIITSNMLASYALSVLISTSTALYVLYSDDLSSSLAGLALTYSFLIPYFLLHCGFISTIVMAALNSLERIVDYTGEGLPQEPPWFLEHEKNTGKEGSGESDRKKLSTGSRAVVNGKGIHRGRIEFRNVTLVYRVGLDPALRNLSFVIHAGEKVGIIGRTGAGKSSVISLLLRILDPSEGFVLVDDIDIKDLGLQTLRKSISIIPQTPLLLSGTVRDNIAPFGEAPLDKMKRAIFDSGLFQSLPAETGNEGEDDKRNEGAEGGKLSKKTDAALELVLESDAESLSAGQKQLLSLTRCLLKTDNKVLICDEPTSNVDLITDKAVQKVVREKFSASTIITVAHRLETIADVDKIIVLEKGQVKQIDKPEVILTLHNI